MGFRIKQNTPLAISQSEVLKKQKSPEVLTCELYRRNYFKNGKNIPGFVKNFKNILADGHVPLNHFTMIKYEPVSKNALTSNYMECTLSFCFYHGHNFINCHRVIDEKIFFVIKFAKIILKFYLTK